MTTECSFCGGRPDTHRGVVLGPGVNICGDCITLCAVILAEDDKGEPANCGGTCPYCCARVEAAHEFTRQP